MTGGPERVAATFWLLSAPDSLSAQSHREPDGTGLGYFDEQGRPVVDKQPLAAYEDRSFAAEAKERRSRTFVAHIRYATTGGLTPENTHPFEQRGLLFAHNGVIEGLDRLEAQLGAERALVHGETDSERFFALISKEIAGGRDVAGAIASAAGWIAANLPVYALNCVVVSESELWALRYPDTHELHVLQRDAGGPDGATPLEHQGVPHELHVNSAHLREQPAVVIASEPMDDDPGWQSLASGELVHVDAELNVTLTRVLGDPPAHPLSLADLEPRAAASQQPASGT
jgi:predicted glutamine amidotransferase